MKKLSLIINIKCSFILIIISLLGSCARKGILEEELRDFRIYSIEMNRSFALTSNDKIIGNQIMTKIWRAKIIKGPVKGIGIKVCLTNNSDTICVISFAGGEYFRLGEKYYQTNQGPLLSDSILGQVR